MPPLYKGRKEGGGGFELWAFQCLPKPPFYWFSWVIAQAYAKAWVTTCYLHEKVMSPAVPKNTQES